MSTILIFIWLVLNAAMTSYLWRTVTRGPKRKFLNDLLNGKPITPQHAVSQLPEGIAAAERQFLADFAAFADDMNRVLADAPWRLQETGDGAGTAHGRHYDIFYNSFRVGTLQVRALDGYEATAQVRTEIELTHARLLPFGRIDGFASALAQRTAAGSADEMRAARRALQTAMLERLWQIEYEPELDDRNDGGAITVRFDGMAAGVQAPS